MPTHYLQISRASRNLLAALQREHPEIINKLTAVKKEK